MRSISISSPVPVPVPVPVRFPPQGAASTLCSCGGACCRATCAPRYSIYPGRSCTLTDPRYGKDSQAPPDRDESTVPELREKNKIKSMQSSLGCRGYPVPRYASSLPVCQSATALVRVLVICRLSSTKLLPLSALILPPFLEPPSPLPDREPPSPQAPATSACATSCAETVVG